MIALFFAASLFCNDCWTTKEEIHSISHTIENHFQTSYAPIKWKSSFHGIDFTELFQGLEESSSSYDFQKNLRKRLSLLRDYHVHVFFCRTEEGSLPFNVKAVGDKVLVSSIDKDKLVFDIQVGDELVAIDSVPAYSFLETFLPENPKPTDIAIACRHLTKREQMRFGIPTPSTSHLTFKRDGQEISYQLAWEYTPEMIPDHTVQKAGECSVFDFKNEKLFLSPDYSKNPQKRGNIPYLGTILWESAEEDPFFAYLYEVEGKTHGFLRIENYIPGWAEDYFVKIEELFKKFEEEAETLIIDQRGNRGGSLFFCYFLLSLMTDQPLITPKHHLTLTDEDLLFAIRELEILNSISSNEQAAAFFGKEIHGYPIDMQFVLYCKQFFSSVRDAVLREEILTEPMYLYGVDQINPHPRARFTKPIVMAVDEACFSGGDFVPAILQDNERATLIGKTTAGAGGFVRGFYFPNRLGLLELRLTGSLAIRSNGDPIEDLGVTPDIEWDVTEEDIKTGYQPYKQKLLEVIKGE